MLSEIEKKIIIIMQKSDTYVTSDTLSSQLEVSSRTIRNYIKNINEYLVQYDSQIMSKQRYGYKLLISNQKEFSKFLKRYILIKNSLNNIPSTSEERQYYILEKLLFEKSSILLDDISEELYVSRSTITTEFREIRNKLKHFNLIIESKPYQGVSISGEERNIRHFIVKYFFENQFFSFENSKEIWGLFFEEVDINFILEVILEETRSHNIIISDLVFQNLVIHIALALKRIKTGNEFQTFIIEGVTNLEVEKVVAKAITEKLEKKFNINIPKEEKLYIALHLSAKKTSDITKYSFLETEEELIIEEVILEALRNVQKLENLNLAEDKTLIQALKVHIKPMIIRLKNEIVLDNPLLKEVCSKYPNEFKLAEIFSEYIGEKYEVRVPESEIGYIAFHFIVSVEKSKKRKFYRAIVVCSTGYGSAILLKHRIEEVFKEIKIINVCSYNKISSLNLDGIDMIISSLPIQSFKTEVPSIQVSIFLNDKDIESIKRFIELNDFSDIGITSNVNNDKIKKNKDILLKYLKKNLYIRNKSFNSQEEVIKYLAELLFDDGTILNKEMFIDYIMQREKLSSTVFNENFAVPHPITGIGTEGRIVFMTLREPVFWGKNKTNLVDTIMLISPSSRSNPNLIDIMDIFSKVALNKELFSRIRKIDNFQDFIQSLIELM